MNNAALFLIVKKSDVTICVSHNAVLTYKKQKTKKKNSQEVVFSTVKICDP